MNRTRLMQGAMLLAIAGLVVAAVYLALHRIFQVDEAQNLYMTRVLASGRSEQFFTNALLWMLGPMAWLSTASNVSFELFTSARMLFAGVFLLNVTLLALNTGRKLNTTAGLLALLGAFTLAPLWDYGFEVRHDNLILTGLLLMWWLGRVAPRGRLSYLGLGLLAALMPFLSFKAVAYAAPLSLAFLLLPPPAHGLGRLALLRAWLSGAGAGLLLVAAAYAVSGAWPVFLAGVQAGMVSGSSAAGFDPQVALKRLPGQVPLLRELVLLALCWLLAKLGLERRRALRWDGLLPEALLFLASYVLLLINPTPFPYNLLNLVPFAYLLAFRFAAPLVEYPWPWRHAGLALAAVLLLWHGQPFVHATLRHADLGNARQKTLMVAAEALTDPVADRVYDASGIVLTRNSIGYYWYNHSLSKAAFASGRFPSVASMLAQKPAAVIIRSYRTNMLPPSGSAYIDQRYVALSDDFMVLGQKLAPGGGSYQVLHPGRYLVAQQVQGNWVALDGAQVAGQPAGAGPLALAAGSYQISSPPGVRAAVLWVGPTLNAPPVLGTGPRLRVFSNFY